MINETLRNPQAQQEFLKNQEFQKIEAFFANFENDPTAQKQFFGHIPQELIDKIPEKVSDDIKIKKWASLMTSKYFSPPDISYLFHVTNEQHRKLREKCPEIQENKIHWGDLLPLLNCYLDRKFQRCQWDSTKLSLKNG